MAPGGIQEVPTLTSLIARCNSATFATEINTSFTLHELILVHAQATNQYNNGNRVVPDTTFDLIAQNLNVRRTEAVQKLPQNLHTLKLTELDHVKAFCDQNYAKGTPQITNPVYDMLLEEIKKRRANISNYSANAKTNPFVCANWTSAILFDIIYNANISFTNGKAQFENKCYDIIAKELFLRTLLADDWFPRANFPITFPAHWSFPTSAIDQIEVMPYSEEYTKVQKFLNESVPTKTIHSIKRIQNYGLYRMFNCTRRLIGARTRILPDAVDARMLWHGCSQPAGGEEIIKFGFYRQYCPNGAIGDGCYFALNASYSNNPPYVLQHSDGSKQLFLNQVIIGNSVQGNYGLKAQPLGSSSVHDGPNHMYCIFDHYQAYPEYVVHYSC